MNNVISNYISSQDWLLSTGAERLPGLKLFYFEGASLDARDNKQSSEDFISYQYKDGCLYFVVCDGVQQSIDSSLAARLLGINVIDVLPSVKGDKKIIESFAEKLRTSIDKIILNTPVDISDPVSGFHIRAREEIGAQVKFACGVVDFKRGKVELYWAGDIRFVVYGKGLEILSFWEKDNDQFWSTRGDYSLDLGHHSWPIENVSRLSITSDGIRENFREILSKKVFLSDVRLVNHRYKIGVDDISGVDIMIVPTDHVDRLPDLSDVKLIKNKSLVWAGVAMAEKYRIYHVRDNSIQHIVEVPSKQKSYSLPNDLGDGYFCVQAISSQANSSDMSKAVHYAPAYTPIPEPHLQDDLYQTPEPKRPVPLKPAPTMQPNRRWQRIAVGCGIFGAILLVVGAIGFATSEKYLTQATMTLTEKTTYFASTPVVVGTMTSSPSSTPPILSPSSTQSNDITISTVVPIETPILTATVDANLNDCQKKTMLDEPGKWMKYQIRPGDNFYRLSQINNISIDELMRVNCYQTTNMNTGNYILIPINE